LSGYWNLIESARCCSSLKRRRRTVSFGLGVRRR